MNCLQQQAFAPGDEELSGECSWASIAEAIRLGALGKTVEEAVDLNRWADLVDGIGMLEARRKPQAGTASALASSSSRS